MTDHELADIMTLAFLKEELKLGVQELNRRAQYIDGLAKVIDERKMRIKKTPLQTR